ncbi:GTP 3',8-cyclase MoaA [Croceicoccus sp. F390]|uniref:GTP 3',8-cyclase n=2 Tax=Croceicoccus esteveae TaxID=3075597 RepID=A0ABU2ZF72_9SPHN|nr:GTP 3',8-cyclase MoaA [Croceicoccus sp. F390]MDT0575244.1 GTP 3',8-cyclase MoaA [Croceicoccus sp. F390]
MTAPPNLLVDRFARQIEYLRLSVTDRCDLRCFYCMPERMKFLPRRDILSLEELMLVADAFIARGVTKIRLTGGEPLVRRDVLDLVRALGRRIGRGLSELTMTTNGTRLAQFAEPLAAAGIRRINVSLDTLDPDRFAALTRRSSLHDVLAGIAAAKRACIRVKLNVVALKGVNEAEIPQIIRWAHSEGHEVTLIEVMPLGEVDGERVDQHLPLTVVQEALESRWTLEPIDKRTGGPARYWRICETGGVLGMITPLTQNFCAGCNRVRVTATGQLFACLGGREQVDLRAAVRAGGTTAALPDSKAVNAALEAAMDEAMAIKPERHHFAIGTKGAAPKIARHMSMTGG